MRRKVPAAALAAGVVILFTSRPAQAQWTADKGLVLRGKIVTMDEKNSLADGEILIQGGVIKAMGTKVDHPAGAIVIDTKGVIFPSLMNLHNHTAYNIEPLYPIGQAFQNRDQWPSGDAYTKLVKDPKNAMETAKTVPQSILYAEVMQIMGGVTVVQGSPVSENLIRQVEGKNFQGCKTGEDVIGPDLRMADDKDRAKIAALDGWFFHLSEGLSPASFTQDQLTKNPWISIEHEYADMRQILTSRDCTQCRCEVYQPKSGGNPFETIPNPDPAKAARDAQAAKDLKTVRAKLPAAEQARLDKAAPDACVTLLNEKGEAALTTADVKTFCGHSAAQHQDLESATTLHPDASGNKAWSKIIGIHCAGLTEADFADWEKLTGGAKIVWSPLSNLMLYGKTTDIPAALRHHAIVCLGTDWTPSGSKNLLWELKVADQVNNSTFKHALQDVDLVATCTRNPAKLLNWGHVGMIKVGMTADLIVVDAKGGAANPYRSLIEATETNVQLVTIGGDPRYGDEAILKQLKLNPDKSPMYEVLKESPPGRAKALDVKFPGMPKNDTIETIESDIDKALAGKGTRTPLNQDLDADWWNYWTKAPDKGGNFFVKDGVLAGVVDIKKLESYRTEGSTPKTTETPGLIEGLDPKHQR
jgi:hypothetical protein